ncbi:MAG: hypothetical protein LBE56_00605 [Tannerella sp.]|jgi:hypothetical protein|nr:hypothetical protein [Tannerella sp.]
MCIKNFKLLFPAVLLSLLLLAAGCSKDDFSNGISVSEINVKNPVGESSESIDFVEVEFNNKQFMTVDFMDNGFTVNLPETVEDYYLMDIKDDFPKGLNISDPQAKICYLSMEGGDYESDLKGNEFRRQYEYRNMEYNGPDEAPETEGFYIYTDRDVAITGKTEGDFFTPISCSLSLKKGWNLYFWTRDHTDDFGKETYSHKEPKGMQWWAR